MNTNTETNTESIAVNINEVEEKLVKANVPPAQIQHMKTQLTEMGVPIPDPNYKASLADMGITGKNVFNGAVEGGKFVAKVTVVAGAAVAVLYLGTRIYRAVLMDDGEVIIDDGLEDL